jgi:CRISPR-associated endonuclease/helicase Cas3
MSEISFEHQFEQIVGYEPLTWQSRLFRDHFANGDLSQIKIIDLPTGLGKTMVMALWLIAQDLNQQIPRRLIYVVDRRTVVDQATRLAEEISKRWGADRVSISTLRGKLADSREWSRDPSKPAIIIGTVDLIGSALLFSGYRSSYKRRPMEAGLLGQDSLLLLDEAHLSKPFEKLVAKIAYLQSGNGSPQRVIRMSATNEALDANQFTLSEADLTPEVPSKSGRYIKNIVAERFKARKTLTVISLNAKEKITSKIAEEAIALAQDDSVIGKRIVVFTRKPEDALVISDLIRQYAPRKSKHCPYFGSVEVLTGTMRGLERDELVERTVFADRWLNGAIDPEDSSNQLPVFLVSTSAGEVGFDLNADHMVCDTSPIDSMIQRLGRVNRRGKGDAVVKMFVAPQKQQKSDKPKVLESFELSLATTVDLLNGVSDVSPKNIASLKSSVKWKEKYPTACTPEPKMVELTDILLDVWSMTSIVVPMPGRPDVAPWIRGIADELPQTTIAWRAELDSPGFENLDIEDIEEWFDTHRILVHETLSVSTQFAAKWFTDRWNRLTPDQQRELSEKLIIVDRAGFKKVRLHDLVDQLSRKGGDNTAAIRNANLILPASFGGIERHIGLLDADSPRIATGLNDKQDSPDVADERGRCRKLEIKPEDGECIPKIIGSGSEQPSTAKFVLNLESDDNTRVQLISLVPKQEKLELGTRLQSLREHVTTVRRCMDAILNRFDISEDIRLAAQLAADFHDHGKNRECWQRTVKGTATPAGEPWTETTLGKSDGEFRRDPRGYRHEFGSLRELDDAYRNKTLIDRFGNPVTEDVFDLAMHLIAVHHGRGRPHFDKGGFDPNAEDRSESLRCDTIRRFARLQRKYGWWYLAWLENLLRCADTLASDVRTAEKRQP